MTTSLIAATTYAAGEQINLFGGVRLTRLAQAAQPGDTELVVERSLGMDDSGEVVVDGVTYAYGSLRDGALGALTVVTPQGTFQGVQAAHALSAVVTDATRNYSALDAVRRSFFVDTAQGADLSVLGRILGVPRSPAIPDDDTYRKIIKAIAYSPRTTKLALNSALTAIIGAGNFVIAEEPDQPASVTVYIDGADLLSAATQGKAYLSSDVAASASGGSLAVPGPGVSANAVHLSPSSFWVQIGEAKPSTATVADSGSLSTQPFAYSGDESTVSTYALGPDVHAQRLTGAGYYTHHFGLATDTRFDVGLQCVIPDVSKLSASDGRRFGLLALGPVLGFGVGMVQSSGQVGLGLCDLSAGGSGALYDGVVATVPQGQVFEVHVARSSASAIELRLNGRRVQILQQSRVSAFGATSIPVGMAFGSFGSAQGQGAVRAAGVSAETATDFGSLYAQVTPSASDTLTFPDALSAADIGRWLRVSDGGGTDASQGQARGLYQVSALLSGTQAKVVGPGLGPVSVSGNTLTCSAVVPPLSYPDDVGRQLVLTGSTQGNNGTYTIAALYADDGATVLARPAGSPRVPARMAQLSQQVARAEAGLDAQALPNFGSKAAQVVLSGASAVTGLDGSTVTIAPRTTLPFGDVPYTVNFDSILSAQVFENVGQINRLVDAGPPPTFVIWPFYINDPTNVVSTYLQDMVAAGVALKVVAGTENAR